MVVPRTIPTMVRSLPCHALQVLADNVALLCRLCNFPRSTPLSLRTTHFALTLLSRRLSRSRRLVLYVTSLAASRVVRTIRPDAVPPYTPRYRRTETIPMDPLHSVKSLWEFSTGEGWEVHPGRCGTSTPEPRATNAARPRMQPSTPVLETAPRAPHSSRTPYFTSLAS